MAYETPRWASRVYTAVSRSRRLALAAMLAVTPTLFLLNVAVGPTSLPLPLVIHALLGGCSGEVAVIVWDVRVPVALAAILVGGLLGVAGEVMQTILDNPLASPYTLGISAGAAFGAAMVYALGVSLIPVPGFNVVGNAFAFAVLTCLLVYALGRVRGLTSEALILAGIAVSYAFHSLLALMEYLASEEALQSIVFWLFGSLYKATWWRLYIEAAALGVALVVLTLYSWRLTALRLGDDVAASMGVSPARLRLAAFIAASLVTAIAVCFHGVIGFVGLVAPHIARLGVGEDQRYLLPASACTGAVVLSASLLAGKLLAPGAVIPIGIITSLVGVPFFLALAVGRRGVRMW